MIRTIERNSTEETEKEEMEKLIQDFERSGYKRDELKKIEEKARNPNNNQDRNEEDTITFPLFYFADIHTFKQILRDAETDLKSIIGETKIIMAVKKNPSIGNSIVQNKALTSASSSTRKPKMWCNELPPVPTSKHNKQHFNQQHQSKTIEVFELQVKKRSLPLAMSTLPEGKRLFWPHHTKIP